MHIIRATLRAYDASTHRAAVQPNRAPAALLTELPVADACPPALLAAGREVIALLWPDGGGAVLGPVGHVVGDWALPAGLSLGGDLTLAGAVGASGDIGAGGDIIAQGEIISQGEIVSPLDLLTPTHDLARRYHSRVGLKEGAADNTPFDLLRFAAPGTASSATQRGVCSGALTVTFTGRHTSGYGESVSAHYFVTVYAHAAQNLKADVQLLGARNEEAAHAVTLTVREKSGASRSELVIEALATHANFDATTNRTIWTYDLHSVASAAAAEITPSIC